jgi:hypothetical protein
MNGLAVDSGFSKMRFPLAEKAGISDIASNWMATMKISITSMGAWLLNTSAILKLISPTS